MRYIVIAAYAVALALLACPPTTASTPPCTALDTRCVGHSVQLCDSRGRWQTLTDCRRVEGGSGDWRCIEVSTGDEPEHNCADLGAEVTP